MPNNTIYGFYVDEFTDAEWSDETGTNTDRFVKIQQAFNGARDGLSMDPANVWITTYRVGVNADLDATFELKQFGGYKVPQLLFAVPDPTAKNQDYDGQNAFFLAKLVGDQLTQHNIALMLKTVQVLDYHADATGKVSFYDPSFHLFEGAGLGFNPISAPGGGLIGLGLGENLEINRTGQILGKIASTLKSLLPWVIAALIGHEIIKK